VQDNITYDGRRPSRGRSVALVAFLFGITGCPALPGVVLRRLLEDVGLSAAAARALLSRMRRHGLLVTERRGRNVDYRLAGDFARGFERVRDQVMAQPTEWSGRYHALLYQVPEQHRSFRDELRRTAVLSGYGILQQGVLIAPTDRRDPLSSLLARKPAGAQVWLSTLEMPPAEAARAASIAWDLADLAERYDAHIERLSGRLAAQEPGSGAGSRPTSDANRAGGELIRDYADLLAPALTDTLREPGLPVTLMPADWPGPKFRTILDQFTTTFGPATQRYLDSIRDSDLPGL